MITYFQTSAIIKLIIVEEGSAEAAVLWDASDLIVSSRLAYAEARAALAAARRAGRLSSRQLVNAKAALEERFEAISLLEVSEQVMRTAGVLAEDRALRGYDAVHLASAFAMGMENVVMATWDRELGEAAHATGLDIAGIRLD